MHALQPNIAGALRKPAAAATPQTMPLAACKLRNSQRGNNTSADAGGAAALAHLPPLPPPLPPLPPLPSWPSSWLASWRQPWQPPWQPAWQPASLPAGTQAGVGQTRLNCRRLRAHTYTKQAGLPVSAPPCAAEACKPAPSTHRLLLLAAAAARHLCKHPAHFLLHRVGGNAAGA